jgi:putative ABC transport system permease protein
VKITARLAYNQLKTNRTRTIWTLIGIVLSTALITAIFSFGASGNTLVKNILGADYGEYGGTLSSLFVIPIIILSSIIIFMSIIVISNAFRVSAGERRIQFGILKSIGATKKQIVSTVIYESMFLSIIGIPIGILVGLILAFIGIEVANHFLEEINSLVNIMMTEFSIVINFIISWRVILASVLISFLSVLISALLPGKKASKTTAIESIRKSEEIHLDIKDVNISPLIEKVFGFEGVLAAKNMKRNKRNLRASIITITIGVVLLINLSSLRQQAKKMESIMYPDIDATVIVDYSSVIGEIRNETTNIEEAFVKNPISSDTADIITKELSKYKNTDIMGIGYDMETYDAIIPREMVTNEMRIGANLEELKEYELSAEIITLDPVSYKEICEKVGVSIGSNILLNHYSYNDDGYKVDIDPFKYEDGYINFKKTDSSILEMKVDGVLRKEDIPKEFFAPNTNMVRLIVPKGDARGYMWLSSPKDIDGFMDYANKVINEIYPNIENAEYMELGYTARVYKIQDYVKIMNIAIVLAIIFIYSFVALLMLIGFTNVISTMSTNVYVRHKEFAVLQSVGMTVKGIIRMINLESVMISLKSLIIGLPMGIITTYLINRPIKATFPIPYKLPLKSILFCVIIVFVVTFLIMRYSVKKVKKNNIIETIRQ